MAQYVQVSTVRNCLVLLLILFAIACGGGTDQRCDADGCTICAATSSSISGTCLNIPAGALSSFVNIQIEPVEASIINSPSISLGDAIRITPSDTELATPANLTINYQPDNLTDFFDIDSTTIFNQSDHLRFIGRGANVIDTNGLTMRFPIDHLGDFEPGVKVEAPLAVGDTTDVPLGNSEGLIILDMTADEDYHFFVTSLPAGFDTDPNSVIMTSTFQITTGVPSSLMLALEPTPAPSPPPSVPQSLPDVFNDQFQLDGWLHERMNRLIRNRGRVNPYPTPRSNLGGGGSGIDYGIDGPTLGEEVTVHMLDVSNQVAGNVVNFMAIVQEVTSNQMVILLDKDIASPPNVAALKIALENNIGPRLQTFFGDYSDVDGDGFVSIVITNKFGGNIFGFYDAANAFAQEAGTDSEQSNEAEVVFIKSGLADDIMASTICHELQHAINFSLKTLVHLVSGVGQVADIQNIPIDTPLEQPFVNEGLSYFAEDICGYSNLSSGPIDFAQLYMATHFNHSLINNGSDQSVTAPVRGANYLFGRYLYEQSGAAVQGAGSSYTDNGGAAFTRDLLSSDFVGAKNYDRVFRNTDALGRDFIMAFKDFMITLLNNSLAAPFAPGTRFEFVAPYTDNFTLDQVGIDLDTSCSLLNPPKNCDAKVTSFVNGSGSVSSSVTTLGVRIIKYGAGGNGLTKFHFSGDADGNLQAVVVRTQ